MYLRLSVLLSALLIATTAFAGDCDRDEYDKADYFAQSIGRKIAAKNDGSKNIRVDLVNCDFNRYSQQFRLAIGVYWVGALSGDDYNTDGELAFAENGGNWEYSESYSNQNLKDWRFFKGLVSVTVLIGSMAAEK